MILISDRHDECDQNSDGSIAMKTMEVTLWWF